LRFQGDNLGRLDSCGPAFVDAARLRRLNAFQLPFLSEIRFELRKNGQHARKRLAAGFVMSIDGCSVALSETPLLFNSRTMSAKSASERASRSIRVTTSTSPDWRKSRISRNSARPLVDVPLTFSARTIVHPAALSVAVCNDK
jgi:hypothetical protein